MSMRYLERTNGNTMMRAGHTGGGWVMIQVFPKTTVKARTAYLDALAKLPRFAGWDRKTELLETKVHGWAPAERIVTAFGGDDPATRIEKSQGRPTKLPEPWRSWAEKLGSVAALADYFGVVPRTLSRWASGEMAMSGPARKLYEALLRG